MNFVEYDSLIFANLADQKVVLLSAENTVFLNAVNICNTSLEDLRINLKTVRLLDSPSVENFNVHNVLIKPNQSCNLVSLFGLEIFLRDGDSLLCFSGGYTQVFDCTVCYTKLNEPPIVCGS